MPILVDEIQKEFDHTKPCTPAWQKLMGLRIRASLLRNPPKEEVPGIATMTYMKEEEETLVRGEFMECIRMRKPEEVI